MANLANVLKEEIRRLGKSEAKGVTAVLRRNSAQHRRDIAALKRQVASLERKVALLEKRTWSSAVPETAAPEVVENARFSAKGLASQRRRLKLSAAQYAKLVGVAAPTLYAWEQGRNRPRPEQLAKIVALRGIAKKEALAMLEHA
jgi:DNA-binding transcriptional regulator YiaG